MESAAKLQKINLDMTSLDEEESRVKSLQTKLEKSIKTIESDLERERSISLDADLNEKRISKEKEELLKTENELIKVESISSEELNKSKRNYSIICEESANKINDDKNNFWIIDPIDGTNNFLHGIPHFAITIALKSNNEIVSGITYDPIKDEMFYAEKNNGAFFNNQRIKV